MGADWIPNIRGHPVRAVSGHDVSVTLTRPSAELPTRDRRRHGYRSPVRSSPKSSCSRVRSVPDLRNRQCWVVHRYYDPAAGQFLNVDPAVALTSEPYVYADDDPIVGVDPLGLWSWNPVADVAEVAHNEAHFVNHIADNIGTEVSSHYNGLIQIGGFALAAVSLATGVGALGDGLVLGELALDSSASGIASVASGGLGSLADGPGCYSGTEAACVGLGLNGIGALIGGGGVLAGAFGTHASAAFLGAFGLHLGLAGLAVDLEQLLFGNKSTTSACR